MKKLVLLLLVALSLALTGCANRGPNDQARVRQIQERADQSNRTAMDTQRMGGPLMGVPRGGAMPPR